MILLAKFRVLGVRVLVFFWWCMPVSVTFIALDLESLSLTCAPTPLLQRLSFQLVGNGSCN